MTVRWAPAIWVAWIFGLAQAIRNYQEKTHGEFSKYIEKMGEYLISARPTWYDLKHAITYLLKELNWVNSKDAVKLSEEKAQEYAKSSEDVYKKIWEFGGKLIKDGDTVATHCHTWWPAIWVGWYNWTAIECVVNAHRNGKKVKVFADATAPRHQGWLTEWEFNQEWVPVKILADNATGLYMKQWKIDIMIVWTDRVALNWDIANKIGTYEKAVLAHENGVPFYIAAPFTTIDFNCPTWDDIKIEMRDQEEVLWVKWRDENWKISKVSPFREWAQAENPAFDVTPAKYITWIITEKWVFKPEEIKNQKPL
jgi:translation initiation factor eIF-2B subunit alpha/methylthioribose-1-phosphate isomerase